MTLLIFECRMTDQATSSRDDAGEVIDSIEGSVTAPAQVSVEGATCEDDLKDTCAGTSTESSSQVKDKDAALNDGHPCSSSADANADACKTDDGCANQAETDNSTEQPDVQGDGATEYDAQGDAPQLRQPAWMEAAQSGDGSKLRVSGMDFYELLGVAQTADLGELKRAFREQALAWHPDKAGPEATEHFQALGEAYEVLADAEQRAVYDHMLSYYPPPRPTAAELYPHGFYDFEPFRASTSDLYNAATFRHNDKMWRPKYVGDVAWQRPERAPSRVRVVFIASYDPLPPHDANSLEDRGQVHDSINMHLATLLQKGGWRTEDEADDPDPAQEITKRKIVVARCCLLGMTDNTEFHLKFAGGNRTLGSLGARFAIEGVPENLKGFFDLSHAFASNGSWSMVDCVFM